MSGLRLQCCSGALLWVVVMRETGRPINEYRQEILSTIETTLDALASTTNWGLAALLATVVATLYSKENTIDIGSLKVPREIAGLATFGLLCALSFRGLCLFQRLSVSLELLHPKLEIASLRIRLHVWAFNPFAETANRLGLITDNAGYALLLLQWWFGAHTGLYLVRHFASSGMVRAVSVFLALLYLALGLATMFLISTILQTICFRKASIRLKTGLTLAAIPLGAFGIGMLFW
jgi:hypothetical protein